MAEIATLILAVYLIGAQLALTVFAARMAFGFENHDIAFGSFAGWRDSVGAYFARLLSFAFLWPLTLYGWISRASSPSPERPE